MSTGTGGGSGNNGPGRQRRPGSGLNGRPGFIVLEGFAGRRSALPFALLLLTVLGAGLVAVLVLNTALDHGAFQLQQAQQQQTNLTNKEQQLQQQVAGRSAPGALASEAAQLGMVPNLQPAFLNPSGAAILGVPSVAATPTAVPTTAPPTTAPPTAATPTTGASTTATPTTTVPPASNGISPHPTLPPVTAEPSGSAER